MKVIKVAVVLAMIGLLIFGGLMAKKYYDDTYVGTTYYAQTPSDQKVSIEEWKSDSGKYTETGRRYHLMAHNTKGEAKPINFGIYDTKDEKDLLAPNTYIEVNASKRRVLDWKPIKKENVPEEALRLIEKNHK